MLKKYFFIILFLASFSVLFTTTSKAEETSVELSDDQVMTTGTKERMLNIVEQKESRKERFELEKQQRIQNIEELKAKQELFKQQREELKAKFDELKLQKLENIKQRGLLVSARYSAVSKAMYMMLERVDSIIEEKKDSGFDTTQAETSITAIELKLEAIKSNREKIQTLIDGIEDLSAEEIPSSLTEIKNISTELKSQYESVRSDMKQLVQSLK